MPSSPDLTPVLSPVQRLDTILRLAVNSEPIRQMPTGKALAALVGFDDVEPRRSWARAYVELTDLLRDARAYATSRISGFDDSPYAKTFNAIEVVFAQVSFDGGPWQNYSQQLNHLANIALPFVVHATDDETATPTIETALLTDLRQDLDRLLEKILASNLPPDFKDELARNVGLLRDSLIRFHVYGAQGVARGVALVVGSIATNETAAKEDQGAVRRTVDFISKLQDVFLKAVKIGKIAAPLLKLLKPGT